MQKKMIFVLILALLSSFLLVSNSFADGNWDTYYELYPEPVVAQNCAVVKFKLTQVMTDDFITWPGYMYEIRYWKTEEPSNIKSVRIEMRFDVVQTVELTDLESDTEYTYKVWGQMPTYNLEGTPKTLSFRTLPKKNVYGELNGDGNINSTDLNLLRRYLLRVIDGFAVGDIACADLNGDGNVNSSDYSLLKRYVLRILDKFPVEEKEEINEGISDGFIEGNSKFAFDIFKEISKGEQGGNVFISPFGISTALSMVYQGAKSDTRKEMAKALGFEGLDITEINKSYKCLLKYFGQLDEKVKLKNSNSIWNNSLRSNAIKEDFISANKDVFNAVVESRDFSDQSVVSEINNWISEATEGKIENMFSRVDPNDISYIISALYFNGMWKEEFDIGRTSKEVFKAEDGSTDYVMMMRKNGKIGFGNGNGYKAVRLPYGDGEMAMYCILPDESTPMNDFIQKMDLSFWNEINNSITETENVFLCLPRFKMEYGKGENGSIMESLKALGMEKAFRDDADFSGISEISVRISDVLHKAVVEVNEKGTEASGGTVIPIVSPGIGPKPEFVANRPFVFVIADEKYDTILFMGKVANGEFAN